MTTKNQTKTGVLLILAIIIFSGFSYFFYSKPPSIPKLKEQTFDRLKNALNIRRDRAISYLDKQKESARSIASNQEIIASFNELNNLFLAGRMSSQRYNELDYRLQELFVTKLGSFYDMLFINHRGDFFYTVKKENDYGKNIGHAQFHGLSLQKQVQKRRYSFIGYEYYSASEEPASFYLFPVYVRNQFKGHIVLQLSINHISDIFVDRSTLGQTGEVYIVNEKQMMLTDSRFVDTSTVLNKRIDTLAVKNASRSKKGTRIIEDYRGINVFSVFEKFLYEGIEWIIISEIDENEVLSQYYQEYESSFYPGLLKNLASNINTGEKKQLLNYFGNGFQKVDVKEFVKIKNGAGLYTKGVATCTAFGVQHSGQFSYLAHLSPTDASYNDNWLHGYFLGNQYTNYVDIIMRRIKHYDVRPHELSQLKFSIGAPENTAFRGIIRRLLNHGIYLHQISIHQKPRQYSMDMVLHQDSGEARSIWYQDRIGSRYGISFAGVNLMSAFKQYIGYQS